METYKWLTMCAAAISLGGCATIVTGTSQNVTVTSSPTGAKCDVAREGGQIQTGTTPMTFSVSKSRHDLTITCMNDVGGKGNATSKSGAEPWIFGNLLFGGIPGLVIDLVSGGIVKYDTPVTVNIVSPPAPILTPGPKGKPVS